MTELNSANTAGTELQEVKQTGELRLERLVLYNFKNYAEAELSFSKQIVCLLGNNGSGKTNILDAIHYLSVTKSFFNQVDSQNILKDYDQCSIQGEFQKDNQHETVLCSIRKNHKKVVKKNYKEYEKLSEHIGQFPSVIVTPYDIELIWEGSEVRRKFIDSTISQQNKNYLDHLVSYNHALTQRNTLLKQFASKGGYDAIMLEPWEYMMVKHGDEIFRLRKEFIAEFSPVFAGIYEHISNNREVPVVDYESELHSKSTALLLDENRDRDRFLERTAAGIHRDDLEFLLDGYSLKKMASQGQQKSYLFALKLAQHSFISKHLGTSPVLMLDDLFDKVDESRVNQILSWLKQNVRSQIFITDTHLTRIPEMLKNMLFEHEIWKISDSKAEKIG